MGASRDTGGRNGIRHPHRARADLRSTFAGCLLREHPGEIVRDLAAFQHADPPQLILLQKTLLNVEGLGRDLYPQLDIWKTASPILREWMRERLSLRQVLHDLKRQMPEIIEVARSIPTLLNGAVQRVRGGNLQAQVTSAEIE